MCIKNSLNTTNGKSSPIQSNGFSAASLKYYAIIAMLIDHIAWAFVPTNSALGQIMHIIGRTTAPIMCFFIAEGYFHTRNVKRYALRLGIFTILFYSPFIVSSQARLASIDAFGVPFPANVMLTLLCGLLTLWAWYELKPLLLKIGAITILCFISMFGDWSIFGVMFIMAFGLNHGNFKKQSLWFTISAIPLFLSFVLMSVLNNQPISSRLFQLAVLLALPILYFYNGKLGKPLFKKFDKWFFYIFYPLHLLIIALIKIYL